MKMINEGSRDNLLQPYVEWVNERGGNTNVSQLKQILLNKFVSEAHIRNLSLSSNYYLVGVARYYFNGDLTVGKKINILNGQPDTFNTEVCDRLNALIMVLRNAFIDSIGTQFEQPEDFGTMSLAKLLRKYNKAINKEMGIDDTKEKEKEELDRNNAVGNGYTYEILYSYQQARKYNKATEPGAWCITYGEHHFDYYVRTHGIHYVVFAKDGYENVPRKKGPNWTRWKPQDEYGNSLICLLQYNNNGEPCYITSRWNHGADIDDSRCEADHAYTKEEFMNIVGITDADLQRIFKIWKEDRPKKNASGLSRKEANAEKLFALRTFKYAQMRINGGNKDTAFEEHEFKQNIPLTNVTRIKEMNKTFGDLLHAGENEKAAQVKKQGLKLVANSIIACTVTINGKRWYFLMDKNQILFDTICQEEADYDNIRNHCSSPEADVNDWRNLSVGLNNILVWETKTGYLLYNYVKHNFVTVDGVKKFKYVERLRYEDSPFYVLRQSGRQAALIDRNTNEPLVLPNGSSWMESVAFQGQRWHNGGATPEQITPNTPAIECVYDSSSGEKYIFDMATRSFLNFPPNTNPVLRFFEHYGDTDGYYGIELDNRKMRLYKNGQPTEVCGISEFATMRVLDGKYMFFRKEFSAPGVFYNIETQKVIPYPYPCDANPDISNGALFIPFKIVQSSNNNSLDIRFIYDVENDAWMKNPCYKEQFELKGFPKEICPYLFNVWGLNCNSGFVTIITRSDEVQQWTISNGSRQWSRCRLRKQGDKFIVDNPRYLEESDIKAMVLECLKRLLN